MIHDFDPVLFHIYGDVGIRWYGLSYIIGFVICYFIIRWLAVRQKAGLTVEMVSDLVTYGALGAIIGGRLGYCLFYSPDLFTKFKPEMPFWGVFAVNEGGMSSHGGMIGIVIACILFGRKKGINKIYLLDLVCVSGLWGVALGRVANFINGELLGREAPADLPWGVKFPQEIFNWPKYQAAKLTDLSGVVEKIGVSATQWTDWIKNMRVDPVAREKVFAGLHDIVSAIQSGNSGVAEALAPMLVLRHPSQLYAALLEGVLLFFILFFLWRVPRKPGFITSGFIVLYAIVRFIDEQFRLPDDHIGYEIMGLTRGQLLSLVMLTIGLICMFVWSRSGTFVVPGWGRVRSVRIGRSQR